MKRLMLFTLLALGAAACAADPALDEDGNASDDETTIADLSLSLTGVDSQGRQYRLRNATFYVTSNYYYPGDVYGPGYYPNDGGTGTTTVVSTEEDPDRDAIRLRLVPGAYSVQLTGDWYIERLTATGFERVAQVVLLNGPYQYAYVYQNSANYLAFRFGVDGELIDFRHGDLVIDTEIELPGDSQYDAGWPSYDAGSPSYDAGVRVR